MQQTENRGRRWKRVTAGAITALVLTAVPVCGALFLGSWTSALAATTADGAGPGGVAVDFLNLDKPAPAASTSSGPRETAADNSPVEIRLNNWTYTRGPTQFN
jgi:hypothetical protein